MQWREGKKEEKRRNPCAWVCTKLHPSFSRGRQNLCRGWEYWQPSELELMILWAPSSSGYSLIPWSGRAAFEINSLLWAASASSGSRREEQEMLHHSASSSEEQVRLLSQTSACASNLPALRKAQNVPNLKFSPAMNFENHFSPPLLLGNKWFLLEASGASLLSSYLYKQL